ncbi:MAG: ABC transporter permease [Chthoniobacterales bacterium]|nr:ABC transporter permease [Chthoniobacterales bacterium]
MNNLRLALRQLRKSPGFTFVAVLTLALGIGANTAIFSVINAVLLRPLPYPEANRIVTLSEATPQQPEISVSWPNYLDWKTESTVFQSLAVGRRESFNLSGLLDRGPERISGFVVTAAFFKVIGLEPKIGRVFSEDEDKPGGQRLAVISDALWQRAFGRDPAVLGRSINLHDQFYTVLGVMPPEMTSPSGVDVWLPLMRRVPDGWTRSMHPSLFAWGRLKPGVSVEQAQEQMKTIAAGLEKRYYSDDAGISVVVKSLLENQVGPYRKNLGLLLGAVGLVLLIACANLANLLAVRGAARAREFALRAALGASRGQIIRQLLVESSIIALLGGLGGFLIAFWGRDAVVALSPASVPRLQEVTLDGRVLAFTVGLALLTNFLFGLWPARLSANPDLQLALKAGAQGSSDSLGTRRTRNWLVVGEIALTLVLLIGAGLVLKSFARAQSLALGFEPRGMLTVSLDLPFRIYTSTDKIATFSERVIEKVCALPGVTDAAFDSSPPLTSRWQTGFLREGAPEPPPELALSADTEVVTGNYFSTIRASLLHGRAFNERDTGKSPPVTIIDQLLADQIFHGENPIGKRLRMDPGDTGKNQMWEIVGVVGRMKARAFDDIDTLPVVYFPQRQVERTNYVLLVRAKVSPGSLEKSIREIVASVDPAQPVFEVRSMLERVQETWAASRFISFLLLVFSGLALLLSMVGLYGVLSYSALRRLREIGIRLAVGAQRSDIRRLILGQGVRLLSLGLTIGIAGAILFSRVLGSFLFEVNAIDPVIYLAVSVLLAFAALLACWLPARRAARVNPIVVLRSE